jgi:hypothetical protein
MATQKKPVVRTSNSNVTGVVVKPNHRKNHSSDFYGRYTFSVSVSVVPEAADKSYVGIISAVAASPDEAKRSIENDLREGFCVADSFVLRRFQPFLQAPYPHAGLDAFVLYRGSTSVDEFFDIFKNRSIRPKIEAEPLMSKMFGIVDVVLSRYSTAA